MKATWLRLVLAGGLLLSPSLADEGLWTFDNLPLAELHDRYGFSPDRAWLDHLRAASVRLNAGGSGAFVSPEGLLVTNQHVIRDQLQRVSSPGKDYLANGFTAAGRDQEIKLPGLTASVLMSTQDVTARVNAAAGAGTAAEQVAARRKAIAAIVADSPKGPGLSAEVVTLYQGGEYWLYSYKVYTDLRLVFVPEMAIANFGGDTDNFNYPRYKLDVAFLRAWENDAPVNSGEFLRWNAAGPAEGDLVFLSGNPGVTQRLSTVAQLDDERTSFGPHYVTVVQGRIAALQRYAAQGEEQARQVTARLLALQNVLKSRQGELAALAIPSVRAAKVGDEAAFRAAVAANPAWQAQWGGAWDTIAGAEKKAESYIAPQFYHGLDSDLANLAQTLVQFVAESAKPDADRMAGYHDSDLPGLRAQLAAPGPAYPALEIARITGALQLDLDGAGPDDPFVKACLDGRSPVVAAQALVGGTKIGAPAFRQKLLDGGAAAVAASDDPMVVLALRLDPIRRATAAWMQANVQGPIEQGSQQLAQARFAAFGKKGYPDGTFTPRLTFGQVKGYAHGGAPVAWKTDFNGLFARAEAFHQKPPFDLPARFTAATAKFDRSAALDFVSTNDIVGGLSGSPVVNRAGELVGVAFDNNQPALSNTYAFNADDGRAIAVHAGAVVLALDQLYGAQALLKELNPKP